MRIYGNGQKKRPNNIGQKKRCSHILTLLSVEGYMYRIEKIYNDICQKHRKKNPCNDRDSKGME
ncbi:hypothetical protein COE09_15465 [Bacillus thuringiensis]|nr:hypothetical protein COE09_15465 [Bacillus thuringiensis]